LGGEYISKRKVCKDRRIGGGTRRGLVFERDWSFTAEEKGTDLKNNKQNKRKNKGGFKGGKGHCNVQKGKNGKNRNKREGGWARHSSSEEQNTFIRSGQKEKGEGNVKDESPQDKRGEIPKARPGNLWPKKKNGKGKKGGRKAVLWQV